MNDKEIFDGCTKLAEIAAARLDFRRQLEWRLSLGLWAVLIASIAYFRVESLPVWVGVAILAAYANWLQSLFVRHGQDTMILWHFFHQAQAILEKHDVSPIANRPELRVGSRLGSADNLIAKIRSKSGFLSGWALRFQFFVTAVLTGMLYLVCPDHVTWLALTPKTSLLGP